MRIDLVSLNLQSMRTKLLQTFIDDNMCKSSNISIICLQKNNCNTYVYQIKTGHITKTTSKSMSSITYHKSYVHLNIFIKQISEFLLNIKGNNDIIDILKVSTQWIFNIKISSYGYLPSIITL